MQVTHLVKSEKLYSPQDIGLEENRGVQDRPRLRTRLLGQTPSACLLKLSSPRRSKDLENPVPRDQHPTVYLLVGTEYFAGACCHIHSPTARP